jgi:hypothetical protein
MSATEDGAGGPRRPVDGRREQTLGPDARFVPTGAMPVERAPRTVTETVIIDAASAADAEQGYPWGWKVLYGEAQRSGACQTRAQAEREAALVLALLKGS